MSALSIPIQSLARSACICCGSARWKEYFRVLRKCRDCGFIRADIDLTHEQVRKLYQEDYFQGEEYGDYLADAVSHGKNFAARLAVVRRLMGRNVGPLFEVGCAYGFWLQQCSLAGIQCAGVDVCVEPVRHARMVMGQNAQVGDFLSLSLSRGQYRAFCLWDTIEHLSQPEQFVGKVYDLLPPGGWLFLTTGDIGSAFASWRGPRWRMIHPPTHLQYFSTETMRRFLNRQGFQVMRCQSTPMYRNIGETLERVAKLGKGISRPIAQTLKQLVPSGAKELGFWLDLGDIMFVAARKTK
ncbi:MAG: class I SAM-dependent methyltransferase [Planctomycetia bacterium]|nr:class I SAM-dependent methyltransferase [Planctomycetia bacterium]